MKCGSRRSRVRVTIAAVNFASALTYSIQAPFYPAEAESKGATATEYGLVFGIFELVMFLFSPIFGHFMTQVGTKFMLISGIFVGGSSCILFGLLNYVYGHAEFIGLSLAIRIVEGLGTTGILTSSFSIIAQEFPDSLGTTFATLEIFFGLGLIVGPSFGGALYELGGFTLPFVSIGTLLLMSIFVAVALLPQSQEYVDDGTRKGNMIELMSNPGVSLMAFTVVTGAISNGFLQVNLEPHIRPLKLSPLQVGGMFVLCGGSYAFSAPLWGKLSDYGISENILIIFGTIITMISFIFIGPAPFIPMEQSLWTISLALLLEGIGTGGQFVPAFTGASKEAVSSGMSDDIKTYGLVSGMWASSYALGAFIGPTCAGILMEHFGFRNASMFIIGLLSVQVSCCLLYQCCKKSRISIETDDETVPLPIDTMNYGSLSGTS